MEIGNQSRPDIFDLSVSRPERLYETVIEVDERVTLEDYVEDPQLRVSLPNGTDLVRGVSGEIVKILKTVNENEVRSMLQLLYNKGIRSIAVCLIHSYTYPDHELIIGKIAKEVGFEHVSLSAALSPMIKYVHRANSCVADSYLTPEIKKYLQSFKEGLKHGLAVIENGKVVNGGVRCQFMQSDGGLVDASSFSGLKAILSGPAGGVVGYSRTCYNPQNSVPLIGFDMGGTSTDVSRFGDGKFEHVFETTTAGVTIQSPQLDINTVAAGGGSVLQFKNGLMQVGPESASSHPGPACYRKGGPLTVTDANLLLGRLVPEFFPKIFGEHENEPLDQEATVNKFDELTKHINVAHSDLEDKSVDEIAYGFLEVACENMARPIRQLTEAKGHITSQHRLVSFGGAGGQCAVHVAQLLSIDTVLIHKYSSVLSAYGMALADVVEENQEPCAFTISENSDSQWCEIKERLNKIKNKSVKVLNGEGFTKSSINFEEFLNMRYQGTESGIMVPKTSDADSLVDFIKTFEMMHKREFGFLFESRSIIIDDIRVRASARAVQEEEESVESQISKLCTSGKITNPSSVSFVKNVCWKTDGELRRIPTEVYRLDDLDLGTTVNGPVIIADGTQTNIVPPGWQVTVLEKHLIVKKITEFTGIKSNEVEKSLDSIKIEPVLLSIFGHRFMDIAEQMGTSLQKTSVSVNVKERLDFSCALFDYKGNLVANAPHLPVHLGSMSACVATQAQLWKGKLRPGDILVTNHPSAGGTHLPDITVVTPAFDGDKIIFYVASRAHHADIGGLLPGSMPPHSTELWQEGAAIFSEFLVKDGKFQEEKMIEKLLTEPAKYPGCSGTRRLSDNLSDLKAQIAANQKGIQLIAQLVNEFSFPVINAYMEAIQNNAAETVQKMLDKLMDKYTGEQLKCTDYMDDGSQISLQVYRDEESKKVVFDFEGTSCQTYNNFNAPTAITYSAIIYCLRCMVDEDIPLNQGCLRPIMVKLPEASLLSPDDGSAVVGGNVCTSQRITDTILKTFKVMADSQGCCNNFTFGSGGNNEKGEYVAGFGYYETIAGGHGASSSWDGTSGVHTNMTNTRITDVEVFEKRYPVIVREFSLRAGSGGNGLHKGGDGVIRDVEFREDVTASILSERRVVAPHGMKGGEDGKRGVNLWIRKIGDDERVCSIGGRGSVNVKTGERIIIMTPGGGGWGVKNKEEVSFNNLSSDDNGLNKKRLMVKGGSLHKRQRQQLEN